ncbi:MAG: chemotaxis protein CheW [Acidocella sp. 20-61-6]|nr:MAG: chemotaxis protein CheW [Acidocella sp. 20-61-6]
MTEGTERQTERQTERDSARALDRRSSGQPEGRRELLSVRIGDQEFAIDICAIREIRGWIASTHLPHAPSYIKGMINLRGIVLLVIDLAERLGLPPQAPSPASVVVVVEDEARVAGLLVDAVCDIITVTDEMRQATPETGGAMSSRYIEGLIMMEQGITGIIAIPAVMPDDEAETLLAEAELA